MESDTFVSEMSEPDDLSYVRNTLSDHVCGPHNRLEWAAQYSMCWRVHDLQAHAELLV